MSRPQFLAPYSANHNRVRKVRGSADTRLCDGCCGRAAKDWALVHERSGFDPQDYVPLCRSCHAAYDGTGDKTRVLRSVRHWVSNPTRDAQGRFARNG